MPRFVPSHFVTLLWLLAIPLGTGADEPTTRKTGTALSAKEGDSKPADSNSTKDKNKEKNKDKDTDKDKDALDPATLLDPSAALGMQALTKDYEIWIDRKRQLVVVGGEICLREGPLEMFACPRGTKEHESIIALNCKAQFVHAALLAVGAKPGSPVKYDPTYAPATGTRVDIVIVWKDEQDRVQKMRAQDWIRDAKTEKPMEHSWVFAGSAFWTDEQTGQRHYQAESGDLVCVSNFTTATLDLPINSSQDNGNLLFTALTDKIPPVRTKVRMVLIPRIEKTKERKEKPEQEKPDRKKPEQEKKAEPKKGR